MLFSVTLEVKAASPLSYSFTKTEVVSLEAITSSYGEPNHAAVNKHVRIPFEVRGSWSSLNIGEWQRTGNYLISTSFSNLNISVQRLAANGSTSFYENVYVTGSDGSLIWTPNNSTGNTWAQQVVRGVDCFDGDFHYSFYLEFDIGANGYANGRTETSYSVSLSGSVYCQYTTVPATEVYDNSANAHLNNIEQSEQAIETSVTSDTGGGLLATIKSWFGAFFDNLIGVFVPEDGFFTDWFSRVNSLLSAKLGMLYAPFDLIISILTAVYGSSGTFTGIPIPEIAWEGTVLIPAQILTFQSLLGNHFSTLQGYVYFGTDVVLLWAFLVLLQRKITLIFRGSESG